MSLGVNPLGAPVTLTVPMTVPGPVGHELDELPPEEPELPELPELDGQQVLEEPELELEPEENGEAAPELPELPELLDVHDPESDSRLASEPSPSPDATCGRTVTRRTKLATAMRPSLADRLHRFVVDFMPHTPSALPCPALGCTGT
jgi:hypothetical protein